MKRHHRLVRTMGKVVGHIDKGVLHIDKEIDAHLYRKLNAWGIAASIFEEKDFDSIQVTEYDGAYRTGKVYRVSREDFLENAQTAHFRGHGLQYFLPLDEWEVTT